MRHTVVHRGRRTTTWGVDVSPGGVSGFTLQLPVSPELTAVDAVICAGGQVASTFAAPADRPRPRPSVPAGVSVSGATLTGMDDDQLMRGRVYGADHDDPDPGPQPGHAYRELVAGPLDGLLLDVTGWSEEELADGAALRTEIGDDRRGTPPAPAAAPAPSASASMPAPAPGRVR